MDSEKLRKSMIAGENAPLRTDNTKKAYEKRIKKLREHYRKGGCSDHEIAVILGNDPSLRNEFKMDISVSGIEHLIWNAVARRAFQKNTHVGTGNISRDELEEYIIQRRNEVMEKEHIHDYRIAKTIAAELEDKGVSKRPVDIQSIIIKLVETDKLQANQCNYFAGRHTKMGKKMKRYKKRIFELREHYRQGGCNDGEIAVILANDPALREKFGITKSLRRMEGIIGAGVDKGKIPKNMNESMEEIGRRLLESRVIEEGMKIMGKGVSIYKISKTLRCMDEFSHCTATQLEGILSNDARITRDPELNTLPGKEIVEWRKKRRSELIAEGFSDKEIARRLFKEGNKRFDWKVHNDFTIYQWIVWNAKRGHIEPNPIIEPRKYRQYDYDDIKAKRDALMCAGLTDWGIAQKIGGQLDGSPSAIGNIISRKVKAKEWPENTNRFSHQKSDEQMREGRPDLGVATKIAGQLSSKTGAIRNNKKTGVERDGRPENMGSTAHSTKYDHGDIRKKRDELIREGLTDWGIARTIAEQLSCRRTVIHKIIRRRVICDGWPENTNPPSPPKYNREEIRRKRDELMCEGLNDTTIAKKIAEHLSGSAGVIRNIIAKSVERDGWPKNMSRHSNPGQAIKDMKQEHDGFVSKKKRDNPAPKTKKPELERK